MLCSTRLVNIISSFALFGLSLSAPIAIKLEKRGETFDVAPNAQGWRAIDDRFGADAGGAFYTVEIGAPFQNGEGCNFVQSTILAHITAVDGHGNMNTQGFSDFSCDKGNEDTDPNTTQLSFNINTGNANGINTALEQVFPFVQEGFNCPNF